MAKRRKSVMLQAKEAEARARIANARLQARIARARGAALATYRAAEKNRLNRDWNPKNVSADLAILPDKLTIDSRARQMVRDDAYACSIKRSFVRNVVGKGINPSPAARDPKSGDALEDFNKAMADAWWDWASRPELVELEGRRNFCGVLRWACGEFIEVGEAFVVRSYRENPKGVGLSLQGFESEQLDRYKTSHTEGTVTREVRGGIEVDEYGRAVAYHVYRRHPNDAVGMARPSPLLMQSERIPADRVCHVYDPERARQTRGVSRLSPILERLRNIDQYDYSQRVAARAEANVGFAITSPVDDSNTIGMEGASDEDTTDSNGNDLINSQPCMVARLNPGEEIQPFTPTRPGSVYDPFMRANLRAASAGVGLSYEQVARDFTNGSYSSQRQAMLEDRREFEPIIELLVTLLAQPVYEEFVQWAIAEGRVQAPGYWRNPRVYDYAEWRGQGWMWISPKDQAYQAEMELKLGLRTKRDILLEMGQDWREVARQRAEEVAFEKSVGAPTPITTGEVHPPQDSAATPDAAGDPAAPDAAAAPTATTGGDEAGIVATEDRISGIDAERAANMLADVSRGEQSPEVVKTLLIGMGFTDVQAAQMVNDADAFEPATPAPDPTSTPELQPAGATSDE